jgi:uncharacterized protein YpuA (DUF1002 family)
MSVKEAHYEACRARCMTEEEIKIDWAEVERELQVFEQSMEPIFLSQRPEDFPPQGLTQLPGKP